jgi:hypothetical protein
LIAMRFDQVRGEAVGGVFQATDLHNSAFCRTSRNTDNELEIARKSISGLLLCGFGSVPPVVLGVLHPVPARPFDRSLLPEVDFCKLVEGYDKGEFRVRWI